MTPDLASADRIAFRRGRLLTLVLVVVTAAIYLWPAAHDAWFGPGRDKPAMHGQNRWADLVVSCAVISIVCGCAWRGGEFTTGCLTVCYSLALVMLILISVVFLTMHTWGAYQGTGFTVSALTLKNLWAGLGAATPFLMGGTWTVFAFWVLVLSDDARFYRRARRRGLAREDESFSEWHRRRS